MDPKEREVNIASFEQVSRIERILEIAAGQHDVDHPMCEACVRMCLDEVGRQVEEAEEEQRAYQRALEELEGHDVWASGEGRGAAASGQEEEQLRQEVADLESEERRLEALLEQLGAEDRQLD